VVRNIVIWKGFWSVIQWEFIGNTEKKIVIKGFIVIQDIVIRRFHCIWDKTGNVLCCRCLLMFLSFYNNACQLTYSVGVIKIWGKNINFFSCPVCWRVTFRTNILYFNSFVGHLFLFWISRSFLCFIDN